MPLSQQRIDERKAYAALHVPMLERHLAEAIDAATDARASEPLVHIAHHLLAAAAAAKPQAAQPPQLVALEERMDAALAGLQPHHHEGSVPADHHQLPAALRDFTPLPCQGGGGQTGGGGAGSP